MLAADGTELASELDFRPRGALKLLFALLAPVIRRDVSPVRRVSPIVLVLLAATALAALPAAASTHHKLFVAVKQNMPAAAEKKLVVAVLVNQNGGPWASSEATTSKPAVFIQENSRLRYLVKVFLESSCKGVCETKGYRISGTASHKLMVIPSCRYASKVFTCSKLRVVSVY